MAGKQRKARRRATAASKAPAPAEPADPATPPPSPPVKGKPGRPSKLSDDVQSQIVASIQAGCFAWVAAAAAGVSKATFHDWMAGRNPRHAAFRNAVNEARAKARVSAESRVFGDDPAAWLRLGPGRDSGPDEPGWTERQKVEHTGKDGGPIALAANVQHERRDVKILLAAAGGLELVDQILERLDETESVQRPASALTTSGVLVAEKIESGAPARSSEATEAAESVDSDDGVSDDLTGGESVF